MAKKTQREVRKLQTGPISPEQLLKNLDLLSLFISTHVQDALRAHLVTLAAGAFFHQKPKEEREKLFVTHPANTLPYSALKALEERAIVTVAETLNDEHNLYPVNTTIRNKEELFLHRNAVSHPMTVDWRSEEMHAFKEAKRDWKDNRPALLWDLHRSINEELRAQGQKPRIETVTVTKDMGVMLHTILSLSCSPAFPLYPADGYLLYLQVEAPRYVEGLEKRPDGQQPAADSAEDVNDL
jgi:hypothetical protein